jgi:hypothetical protein
MLRFSFVRRVRVRGISIMTTIIALALTEQPRIIVVSPDC